MNTLQVIWRKYLVSFCVILGLLTTSSIVVFQHPLFWEGVTLLQDSDKRISLLQFSYFPTLFIMLGGMQVMLAGLLLIGECLYLLFHGFSC
ncbi:hypothetical protein [Nostoc sp. CHAB 5715]|uniref:hypothetical protein n=1 Tax=Nostoc sp. CHAB 5715 TaxID=2780400 RepID=UPI001E35CC60|nr:hypothetical protein [Nostoc sp. CHAB 5715]MCC5624464.1 hypothetical protein [Nostoc sp. CHAB 5715]